MNNRGLTSGTILDNRYKIESTLGSGGFGITYLAVNERIDLQVCVKEFFNSEYMYRAKDSLAVAVDDEYRDVFEEDKARLLREARILSGLKEMNGIARVLDYFEANGTAYLVMEYIEGETLKKHISEKGALSEEELLQSMRPLMETLTSIHEAGVIHRDISPDNIMVTPNGDLKLIDFGAARMIGGKTRTTAMVYKDGYAPPEQYTSDSKKGPWTDVYALCATFYYCLTKTVPENSLHRVLNDELQRPSELGAVLSADLEKAIIKGMKLETDNRWQTVGEMMNAVHTQGSIKSGKSSKSRRSFKPFNKKQYKIIIGAVAAILVVIGIILAVMAGAESGDSGKIVTKEKKGNAKGKADTERTVSLSAFCRGSRKDMEEMVFSGGRQSYDIYDPICVRSPGDDPEYCMFDINRGFSDSEPATTTSNFSWYLSEESIGMNVFINIGSDYCNYDVVYDSFKTGEEGKNYEYLKSHAGHSMYTFGDKAYTVKVGKRKIWCLDSYGPNDQQETIMVEQRAGSAALFSLMYLSEKKDRKNTISLISKLNNCLSFNSQIEPESTSPEASPIINVGEEALMRIEWPEIGGRKEVSTDRFNFYPTFYIGDEFIDGGIAYSVEKGMTAEGYKKQLGRILTEEKVIEDKNTVEIYDSMLDDPVYCKEVVYSNSTQVNNEEGKTIDTDVSIITEYNYWFEVGDNVVAVSADIWDAKFEENFKEIYKELINKRIVIADDEKEISDLNKLREPAESEKTHTGGEEASLVVPDYGKSSYSADQQILPYSSKAKLTDDELSQLNQKLAQAAINEIYARNGYVFKDKKKQHYYETMPGYEKVSGDQDTIRARLNSSEKYNIDKLEQIR